MRSTFPIGSLIIIASAFALLVGCSSVGGGGGDGDAGAGSDRPDAAPFGGQVGESCERATDCAGGLICDPATSECADGVSCNEHDDCGLGAHCAGDQCAQSGDVSPCANDDNCAAGDECIGGFCGCRGEVFEAELVDVHMMILLDRSGSMAWGPDQTVPDPCRDSQGTGAKSAGT